MFSILHPVAKSPQSGSNTPKHPQKQGGGDFPGAPGEAGRAGPAFTPRRRALLFVLVTQPFPHEQQKHFFPPRTPALQAALARMPAAVETQLPTVLDASGRAKSASCLDPGNQRRQKVRSGINPLSLFRVFTSGPGGERVQMQAKEALDASLSPLLPAGGACEGWSACCARWCQLGWEDLGMRLSPGPDLPGTHSTALWPAFMFSHPFPFRNVK